MDWSAVKMPKELIVSPAETKFSEPPNEVNNTESPLREELFSVMSPATRAVRLAAELSVELFSVRLEPRLNEVLPPSLFRVTELKVKSPGDFQLKFATSARMWLPAVTRIWWPPTSEKKMLLIPPDRPSKVTGPPMVKVFAATMSNSDSDA